MINSKETWKIPKKSNWKSLNSYLFNIITQNNVSNATPRAPKKIQEQGRALYKKGNTIVCAKESQLH